MILPAAAASTVICGSGCSVSDLSGARLVDGAATYETCVLHGCSGRLQWPRGRLQKTRAAVRLAQMDACVHQLQPHRSDMLMEPL